MSKQDIETILNELYELEDKYDYDETNIGLFFGTIVNDMQIKLRE